MLFWKAFALSLRPWSQVFVVSSLLANTYRETDVTEHKPLKVAPISSVLELAAEKSERWLEVVLPCGHHAFVQRGDGDIREAPWTWPRRSVEDTIALAKRFLGLPYTWGGTSPLGLQDLSNGTLGKPRV